MPYGLVLSWSSAPAPVAVWLTKIHRPLLADKPDMTWFTDARLGIFIHWGIYSEGNGSESWAFHDGSTPYETYTNQARTFTAANYDPEKWAELFKAAGAKYAVLTSKHHDGFALWDTAQSKFNAKDYSPAGRDLIGPYCEALRANGLKVGLYFSHLDWSHPDYASVLNAAGVSPSGPHQPVFLSARAGKPGGLAAVSGLS